MDEERESSVEFRKVPIEPIECLKGSVDLLRGRYWLFFGISVVGILIASIVPFGILLGPMMCGIYLCYRKLERGEEVRFQNLFDGFDWFKQSLIAALIQMALVFAVLVPYYVLLIVGVVAMEEGGRQAERMGPVFGAFVIGGSLLFILFCVIITVLFFFTFMLIMDRGLDGIPAIKTSARAAWTNLWGLLGLILLVSLISLLAAVCCYFPAFLVMPYALGAYWLAYRKVFPSPPHTAEVTPEPEFGA